jgi:hypothetical protein
VGNAPWSASRPNFSPCVWTASRRPLAAGSRAAFPPEVEIQVVRPWSVSGRLYEPHSLSLWDCHKRARQLIPERIIENISASTVRQILATYQRQPGPHYHLWLPPKYPRDTVFCAIVAGLIGLYTCPRRSDEMVLSLVHCSEVNHLEQWFSILQRKRLPIVEFTSKDRLCAKLEQFMPEWT